MRRRHREGLWSVGAGVDRAFQGPVNTQREGTGGRPRREKCTVRRRGRTPSISTSHWRSSTIPSLLVVLGLPYFERLVDLKRPAVILLFATWRQTLVLSSQKISGRFRDVPALDPSWEGWSSSSLSRESRVPPHLEAGAWRENKEGRRVTFPH